MPCAHEICRNAAAKKFCRMHYRMRESARWNLITMRAIVRELEYVRADRAQSCSAIARGDRDPRRNVRCHARMRDTRCVCSLASSNATRQARRPCDACSVCTIPPPSSGYGG